MSFKSREKKRRARLAQTSSQREQRSKYADRHSLTIVSRACCCNRCGASLRERRDDCVYRHTPMEILCLNCATVLGESGVRVVAMPLVATGNARLPVSAMLPPLLEAAIQWVRLGLALDRLLIAVHSPNKIDEARECFAELKSRENAVGPDEAAGAGWSSDAAYDVFSATRTPTAPTSTRSRWNYLINALSSAYFGTPWS